MPFWRAASNSLPGAAGKALFYFWGIWRKPSDHGREPRSRFRWQWFTIQMNKSCVIWGLFSEITSWLHVYGHRKNRSHRLQKAPSVIKKHLPVAFWRFWARFREFQKACSAATTVLVSITVCQHALVKKLTGRKFVKKCVYFRIFSLKKARREWFEKLDCRHALVKKLPVHKF